MMTEFLKNLKERASILEVVGEYVRLRKTGSNHMGLCPFHAERSPSFSISEKKGIYHCFGCQRGGDVISFVQEIQGVPFQEAVKLLAARFSVQIPPELAARLKTAPGAAPAEDKLEVYYKLNRFVAQFYHQALLGPAGAEAREYLAGRGISEETIKTAYLGYASAAWSDLYDFLADKKAPLDKAEELGLIRLRSDADQQSAGRNHYDLFRDRVMFPVTDSRGRVIAFGGRAIGASDGPKYLNSSESPVFKKSRNLFGLFHAQKDIRAEDLCVVVEGFMDCIMLRQAGIGYAVATLGTALTEQHVQILKRFTRNIVLLFDGDAAGQEAQARGMETFLNEDIVVKGVTLPDELDPDEFVRERGGEALVDLLRNAPFVLDQKILDLVSKAGVHAEARARALDQALPWIAKIGSDTARLFRAQDLAGRLDMSAATVERGIEAIRSKSARPASARVSSALPRPAASTARPARHQPLDALDSRLIELLVMYPGVVAAEIRDPDDTLKGLETEAAGTLVSKLLSASESGALGSEILAWTEDPGLKPVLTAALVTAERETDRTRTMEEKESLVREARDLVARLTRRGLERRQEKLRAVIQQAEGKQKTEELSRLMGEYTELRKALERPIGTSPIGTSPIGTSKEVR